jgi:hypothetical protein
MTGLLEGATCLLPTLVMPMRTTYDGRPETQNVALAQGDAAQPSGSAP